MVSIHEKFYRAISKRSTQEMAVPIILGIHENNVGKHVKWCAPDASPREEHVIFKMVYEMCEDESYLRDLDEYDNGDIIYLAQYNGDGTAERVWEADGPDDAYSIDEVSVELPVLNQWK